MDPITAFEKVKQTYIDYIKTAFGTKYPGLEREREEILNRQGVLCQEPYIEPILHYKSSGKKIYDLSSNDLTSLTEKESEDFKHLASCGLFQDYELYAHQLEMLTKALSGHNVVVTAGTGSGKTEAFLLPLFAYLAKESTAWCRPDRTHLHQHDWWKDEEWISDCLPPNQKGKRSPRVSQRANETRPAAIRALIVYPMNALVEDQLTRIRKALDSSDAQEWFVQNRFGNRIYFGRYNSNTPVPGNEYKASSTPDRNRICKLTEQMRKRDNVSKEIARLDKEDSDKENRFHFQSLEGSEMRSRWDMQDYPPDILITNFSMLSVMLMRDTDSKIFEHTNDWLKRDGSVFHLIIDELHLYRGTAGTEVAFLLRLLLLRLGLEPNSPKLKVLGSSASLDQHDDNSIRFLKDFFGGEWSYDNIVPGYHKETTTPTTLDLLPIKPFQEIAGIEDNSSNGYESEAINCLNKNSNTNGQFPTSIESALTACVPDIEKQIYVACSKNGKHRATSLTEFSRNLFGHNFSDYELRKATKGLFRVSEMCSQHIDLPSYRLHWFFRNVEGLWACTEVGCKCPQEFVDSDRTVGKLFHLPRLLCDNQSSPHRVLQLLYSECCGSIFLGGNRFVLEENRGFELLSTDADIERIPDRNFGSFVERKTYNDFAIFWPKGSNRLHEDSKTWNPLPKKHSKVNAKWIKAGLDTCTARVELSSSDNTPGFLYHITEPPDDYTVSALPAICPLCNADYSKRKYRKSPISGFRSGFSRVTQLLSKELFYQLPESAKKLVLFSDSRQDAADLANGIERSHYSDLVREAMHDELGDLAVREPNLMHDLRQNGKPTTRATIEYATNNPKKVEKLSNLLSKATKPIPQLDDPELMRVLSDDRDKYQKNLAEIESRYHRRNVPLRILFEGDNYDLGALIHRLATLGVNPAGHDIFYQEFKYDNEWRKWTTLFDLESSDVGWADDLSSQARNSCETLRTKVAGEISSALFARLYFGFESSGLGYALLDLSDEALAELANDCALEPDVLSRILSAVLRVLGEMYRYPQESQFAFEPASWPSSNNIKAGLRRFIKKCAIINNADPSKLLKTVWTAFHEKCGHEYLILNPRKLLVHIAVPKDPVWLCNVCRRPHLYSPGICTIDYCHNELSNSPSLTCEDLYQRNFIAKEAIDLRKPIRLHAEELTAQTDDQAERQQLFRNIVFDFDKDPRRPVIKRVDTIDLLSVTTTMEVGIDIGELQGIVLGNMPPNRFNYQQRAGRSGRRGQAFATVLAICRGRSHDDFYYRNPERILNDPPPAPFLAASNLEIAQRLMAKETLRRAFRQVGIPRKEITNPPDSHGEFGLSSVWKKDEHRKAKVAEWLNSSPEIEKIALSLVSYMDTDLLPEHLIDFARNQLFSKIESTANNSELSSENLAERLAEAAILPMYGMPSRVRELYHTLSSRRSKAYSINRDLDLAVTEFAPGSQRTKDKRVHEAIGFTSALSLSGNKWKSSDNSPFPKVMWMSKCDRCQSSSASANKPTETICSYCDPSFVYDNSLRVFKFVVPNAFRTDLSKGKDHVDETELLITGVSTIAESDQTLPQALLNTNCSIASAGKGRVYRVNDRRGKLFKGSLGSTSSRTGKSLENQWIEERFQNNDYLEFKRNRNAEEEELAIVSPKTTYVLRIRPTGVAPGLLLDPTVSARVRSAYYSAAFILRSLSAEILDIDPDEIEICNIRRVIISNQIGVGEIILNDKLANGAGFTEWIKGHLKQLLNASINSNNVQNSFISSLLSDEHIRQCDSASYDCLYSYRNMSYHGILDWRLGIALLRVLNSDKYNSGLDGNFAYPELEQWHELAKKTRDQFVESFNVQSSCNFGPLPGMMLNETPIIMIHPLWNPRKPSGVYAEALNACGTTKVKTLNTFDLQRRPSWSYQQLATQ